MSKVNLPGREQGIHSNRAEEWDTATKAHGKRLFVFQTITWAGEMAQRVKVLAVKTERQSWIPGTHMAEGE